MKKVVNSEESAKREELLRTWKKRGKAAVVVSAGVIAIAFGLTLCHDMYEEPDIIEPSHIIESVYPSPSDKIDLIIPTDGPIESLYPSPSIEPTETAEPSVEPSAEPSVNIVINPTSPVETKKPQVTKKPNNSNNSTTLVEPTENIVINPTSPVETKKPQVTKNPINSNNPPASVDPTKPIEIIIPSAVPDHKHNYGKWTYLDDNKEQRVCSCGEKETKGHNYTFIKYDESKETLACTSCGHQKTRAHKLDNGVTNSNNTITYKCLNLGCNYKKTVVLEKDPEPTPSKRPDKPNPPHKHNYHTEISYESLNNGKHNQIHMNVCSCGHKEEAKKNVESCDYKVIYNADGETLTCKKCNYKTTRAHSIYLISEDKDTHDKTYGCRTCDYKYTEKHKHDYESSTAYETNNNGKHDIVATKTCKICGKSEEVSRKEESCDYKVSYTADGETLACTKCHYSTTREHDFYEKSVDPTTFDITIGCHTCGYTYTEKHRHDFETSTTYETNNDGSHDVVVTGTCKVCGKTQEISRKEASCDYKVTYTADGETLACTKCHYSKPRAHSLYEKSVDEKTGDTTFGCHTCDYTYFQEHTHIWTTYYKKLDSVTHEVTSECNKCGKTKTSTESHSFSPLYEGSPMEKCDHCGYTRVKTQASALEDPATLTSVEYTIDKPLTLERRKPEQE